MKVWLKVILILVWMKIWSFSLSAQNKYNLKEALKSARLNNPVLKVQFQNIAITESNVITAGLRPNPIFNNQTLQIPTSKYFFPNSNWNNDLNRQTWWQLTKPIQWPGQRSSKIERSEKEYKLSQSEYTESERNILLEVALQWLEVWTAQKKLDILLLAKTNVDSLNHINQLRYDKEVITETDLLRTELLASQFELQIKISRQQLFVEGWNLKFLLGTQDSIQVDTADNFNYNLIPQSDSLIRVAKNHRADVLSALRNIDLSESNIRLQKKLAFPVPQLGVVYNPQNAVPYLGIYANTDIPIFSRNQGEIKKSYLLKRQAEQNYQTIQLLLYTEVNNAYSNFLVRRSNVAKYQIILNQSEQILKNVLYSYLRGGTTIIDFLEAQRSWLDTRQQYYEELQEFKGSYIQLLFTTGLINQLAQ